MLKLITMIGHNLSISTSCESIFVIDMETWILIEVVGVETRVE